MLQFFQTIFLDHCLMQTKLQQNFLVWKWPPPLFWKFINFWEHRLLLLMWSWWMWIQTEDFTDVTLASEDTEDNDDDHVMNFWPKAFPAIASYKLCKFIDFWVLSTIAGLLMFYFETSVQCSRSVIWPWKGFEGICCKDKCSKFGWPSPLLTIWQKFLGPNQVRKISEN